jgi:hypothetical protein
MLLLQPIRDPEMRELLASFAPTPHAPVPFGSNAARTESGGGVGRNDQDSLPTDGPFATPVAPAVRPVIAARRGR